MKRGMLQIYYGEGQGKTSAALGNAIRYASAGKTVCIVQFMKGQLSTSYLSRLEPEIKIFRFYTDVTLTGRGKLPGVFEMADTIYNLVPEKVPSP